MSNLTRPYNAHQVEQYYRLGLRAIHRNDRHHPQLGETIVALVEIINGLKEDLAKANGRSNIPA